MKKMITKNGTHKIDSNGSGGRQSFSSIAFSLPKIFENKDEREMGRSQSCPSIKDPLLPVSSRSNSPHMGGGQPTSSQNFLSAPSPSSKPASPRVSPRFLTGAETLGNPVHEDAKELLILMDEIKITETQFREEQLNLFLSSFRETFLKTQMCLMQFLLEKIKDIPKGKNIFSENESLLRTVEEYGDYIIKRKEGLKRKADPLMALYDELKKGLNKKNSLPENKLILEMALAYGINKDEFNNSYDMFFKELRKGEDENFQKFMDAKGAASSLDIIYWLYPEKIESSMKKYKINSFEPQEILKNLMDHDVEYKRIEKESCQYQSEVELLNNKSVMLREKLAKYIKGDSVALVFFGKDSKFTLENLVAISKQKKDRMAVAYQESGGYFFYGVKNEGWGITPLDKQACNDLSFPFGKDERVVISDIPDRLAREIKKKQAHNYALKKLDITRYDVFGMTVMHYLLKNRNHWDVIKEIKKMRTDFDANLKSKNQNPLLLFTVFNNLIEAARYLITECKADINLKNDDAEDTPLHAAASATSSFILIVLNKNFNPDEKFLANLSEENSGSGILLKQRKEGQQEYQYSMYGFSHNGKWELTSLNSISNSPYEKLSFPKDEVESDKDFNQDSIIKTRNTIAYVKESDMSDEMVEDIIAKKAHTFMLDYLLSLENIKTEEKNKDGFTFLGLAAKLKHFEKIERAIKKGILMSESELVLLFETLSEKEFETIYNRLLLISEYKKIIPEYEVAKEKFSISKINRISAVLKEKESDIDKRKINHTILFFKIDKEIEGLEKKKGECESVLRQYDLWKQKTFSYLDIKSYLEKCGKNNSDPMKLKKIHYLNLWKRYEDEIQTYKLNKEEGNQSIKKLEEDLKITTNKVEENK